jgi:hypothetical protein
MAVEIRRQPSVEDRHEFIAEERAPGHPLKVVSSAVVIRAIEAPSGKGPLEPPEDLLVRDVHPEGHLRLAAIAIEVILSDHEPDEESDVDLRWCSHPRCSPSCFTGNIGGMPISWRST